MTGRIVKLYSKRGIYFMSVFFQGTSNVGRQHLVLEVPPETFSDLHVDDEVRLVVNQDIAGPVGGSRRILELGQ